MVKIKTKNNKVIGFSVGGNAGEATKAQQGLFRVPSSPVTEELSNVLSCGKDLLQLKGRNRDKAKQIALFDEKGNIYNGKNTAPINKVAVQKGETKIFIELTDLQKFSDTNKTAKKFFFYNLIKINEQAYCNGELRQDFITYSLQELVNLGFYSDVRNARRGFKAARNALSSITVSGTIKRGKKEIYCGWELLFTGGSIYNGLCKVFINERLNWDFLTAYFTLLPRYAFALSNRSFDLVSYISYLARQQDKLSKIKKQDYFNISLLSIHAKLGLPTIEESKKKKKPTQLIKQPIEEALQEIASHDKGQNIKAEIIADNNASVEEWLKTGYLKVTLIGEYKQKLIELQTKKEKAIETAEKRKQKIIDTALTKNLEKSLEKQAQ